MCDGELLRLKGISIDMYFFDTKQHNKPHVHADYGSNKITIGIDGEVLAGDFPAKQLKIVRGILLAYEDEFYDAWNKAVRGENPGKIVL